MIKVRRVYEPPLADDGERWLVDRLWPRGLKRHVLRLTGWAKEAAPSHTLRRWFAHDPEKWEEFLRRYFAELDANPASWQPILEAAVARDVTLLYAAQDAEHNNAVALRIYLERRLHDG
ncbi:MAG: DUF488 domain-containing protein [Anaerolineae bacterium]